MERLDCVVIGAGLSGLAIARSLSECGREVVVLEAESEFGTQTSSRNSEVIHAGIYYPNDTLKATLCVTGKAMLYRYCEEHGVPFSRTGKVIVATSADEEDTLRGYQQQAVTNGVNDLQLISGRTLSEFEPAVNGQSALLSPSSGIVNSHDLMVSLIGAIEAHGGSVIYRSPVTGIAAIDDRLTVTVDGDTTIICNAIVNAAGLRANDIATEITGFPTDRVPDLHLSIGHYYAYQGRSPFTGLVYPIKKYFPSWRMELTDPAIEAAVRGYRQAFASQPDLGFWTFSTNGVATAGLHGIPTVGFGPGEEKWAHAPDERIAVEDLVRAAAFYMSFATEFARA